MAAPSTPVIQNVSTAYWFGSNVRAEWVTLIDVTSCAATLTLPDGTTQSVTVNSSQIDAYTTQWVARPAPASVGRYVLSVTATNADGTSDAGTATFMVVDYPIIVISPANGSTVTGLPLDISWVISDSTGVATQRIRITDSDGETMYSIEPPNTVRQLSLSVAELAGIEDGASYAIWLDMTNGVGLSMSAHSTITTSWQPPVTPTATVSTDPDTLAANVTVTGDRTYTFTDVESFTAPESGVITSLAIDGKSVQDGTPTPSAPVAIRSVESYNLIDVASVTTSTVNDITWTANGDGTFDADGTASANSTIGLGNFTFESGVSYRVSGCPSGGGSTAYEIMVQLTTSSSSGAWKHEYGNGVTFTGDGAAHRVQLVVRSGAHVDHILFKPMVKTGNASAAFVPFGCIGLSSSDGSTAYIDLQGHALRSLPDGTHDELTGDSAGVCEIDKNVGMYDSTGVTFESTDISAFTTLTSAIRWYVTKLTDPCVSAITTDNNGYCTLGPYKASPNADQGVPHFYCYASRVYCLISTDEGVTDAAGAAAWMNAHPLQITYKLATEQTISLGTITPPFVADDATVAIDAAATPTFDATMRAAQSAGTPLTDTLMVVRVSPDGTRHVLADGLESGDTVTDPLPPLGVEYAYEVTGIAATGVPSTPATVTHTNVTTCWAMNFGTGAAEVVLARFNPKASYSVEQGGEAYHFADGGEGDGLPVWYPTTEREISGADTWDTLTHATADRLNALMLRYPVGWLRDPFGHRWRAHMKPKFSHGIGKLWQVAIDWDAVRWVEA